MIKKYRKLTLYLLITLMLIVLGCSIFKVFHNFNNDVSELKLFHKRKIELYKKVNLNFNEELNFYLKYLAISENKDYKINSECLTIIAEKLAVYSPEFALSYYFKLLKIAKKQNDFDKVSFTNNCIALCYFKKKNFNKAYYYWDLNIKQFQRESNYFSLSSMYNNLAIIHFYKNEKNKCFLNRNKAIISLKKSEESKERDYFEIVLKTNCVSDFLHFNFKNDSIQPYLNQIFNFHKKNHEFDLKNFTRFVNLYNFNKEIISKDLVINKINQFIISHKNERILIPFLELLIENGYCENQNNNIYFIYLNLTNVEFKKHNIESESFLRNYYTNSILILKQINKIQFENEQKKKYIVYIIFISFLFLIGSVSFFIFNKIKKNKLIQDNEIEQNRLKINQLNLNSALKFQAEEAFKNKLKELKTKSQISNTMLIREMQRQIDSILSIDNHLYYGSGTNTLKFSFKEDLKTKYPDLTRKELILCIYFSQNLSSKEIASILNITDATVRVYKSKIKNKILGSNSDLDLSDYLKSFYLK